MQLPTEYSEPKNQGLKNFNMILFGPPKVGKTSFAADWPDSLIIECEMNGADHIRCKKVDVNSMEELREVYKLVKEDKVFKTIVIDSLDKVAAWIEQEICSELGTTSIMESKKGERNGVQWGMYKERVLGFVLGTMKLGKNVIFISHTKKAETDANGSVINPKSINLYGATASEVLALVSNIGYMMAKEVEGGKVKHYVSFKAGQSVEAGSRSPALRDKIIEVPLGKGYEVFEQCFNPKPVSAAPKTLPNNKTQPAAGPVKKEEKNAV